MSTNLSLMQMLEGATVIPYSEELINSLMEACQSYKIEDEFARVEELIVAFVTGRIPKQFKSHIHSAMIEQSYDEVLTDDVLVRLAQYVVLDTIINNEDELKQTICASKLMNYMLTLKALKRSLPNKDIVLKAYNFHLSKYLENVDCLRDDESTGLRSLIPKTQSPLIITPNDWETLRLVFKEAELYRIERLLTVDKIQNIENPFVRVYVGLSEMFDHLPYCFYNLDWSRILTLLISNKEDKKRKKLSNIINEILFAGCKYNNVCSESSVILWMISGKENKLVEDLMLPIKEFAIYLYYELLTEKIIDTLS